MGRKPISVGFEEAVPNSCADVQIDYGAFGELAISIRKSDGAFALLDEDDWGE